MWWICVFTYRTWAAPLSVIVATRAQLVARRAMSSVSEIPSKCSFVGQKIRCLEPSLFASLCHFQHQTLIQSSLWMCVLTGQRREVASFSGARGPPIEENPLRVGLHDERRFHG